MRNGDSINPGKPRDVSEFTGYRFEVTVSPNPAQAEVRLSDHSPESIAQERTWRIFSSPGRVVRSAVLAPGAAEQRLDLRGLPPGLYCWELLRADGRRAAGRLVVQ